MKYLITPAKYLLGYLYILYKACMFPVIFFFRFIWDFDLKESWEATWRTLFQYFYLSTYRWSEEVRWYYPTVQDWVKDERVWWHKRAA